MSVTASRTVQIQYSGDITLAVVQSAADNTTSSGMESYQTLASGANTISAPVISGITVVSLTIIPPAANTASITVKGVTGDTGVVIHKTDPTTIAVDTTFTSLVLTASTTTGPVRLIWT